MNKYYKNIIIGIIVFVAMFLIIGASYAFFTARIVGNEDAKLMKLDSGTIELTFVDNNSINLSNAKPGDSESKTFIVQNTGTLDDDYNYNIKLVDLNVTFLMKDLEYTLEEYTDDSYTDLKEGGVKETGFINTEAVNENKEMYLAVDIPRPEKSIKHYYKLTITFKELEGVNQNYNQGAIFNGKINVDDNNDAELYEAEKEFSKIMKVDNATIFEDDFKNIRYAGPSEDVNNYIWFNCNVYTDVNKDNAESEKGCEKWRIIGLFKNMQKVVSVSEEGVATYGTEDLVKIIRADSVGDMKWDSSSSYGSNNWTKPASLQKSLTNYYNGTKIGNSTKGITDDTRGMIETVTWNLGGHTTNAATAQQFYNDERGETVPSGAQATWDGYIGLMYPSDYGYATTGGDSSDRAACLTTILSNYNSTCYQKDWLYLASTYQWTLTSNSSDSFDVFRVHNTGYVTDLNASTSYSVRPSLYLKSNVKVVGGKGTSDEPYILTQA